MSTNLSKQKRDDLLNKIKQIKAYIESSPQDENTKNLLAYLGELTKEVNGKKYGLVFEEHREAIDEILEKNAPVLTEEEDLFINNGGEMNFLIEGDNLAALKLLEKTHKGKIDVIYIDPPYNTGNKDFIYDDSFVDSNDEFKHSKWLSFMGKRLELAKQLLNENGVIFISIDDNEQTALRLKCDEIFGEQNYIATFIWRKKSGGGQTTEHFAIEHEYIVTYAKNTSLFRVNYKQIPFDEKIFNKEINGKKAFVTKLEMWGTSPYREDRPSLYYPIKDPNGNDFYPKAPDGRDGRWRKKPENLDSNHIYWQKSKGILVPYEVTYQEEMINEKKTIMPRTIFYDLVENTDATKDIISIFGKRDAFPYSKPRILIQTLLQYGSFSSSTILDFFAGSGTTGHAVMKLNAEDGGHRKFILCTNNENGICRDITYQRLKTVITGKRKDGSDYDEKYNASLKYYKIDYIPIEEKMYYEYADELLEHVRELVELENAIDFNTNQTVAIVLDDEELEDFVNNIDEHKECKILYKGHDVLSSYKQEQILKAHGISVNVVPDYYYRDLAD